MSYVCFNFLPNITCLLNELKYVVFMSISYDIFIKYVIWIRLCVKVKKHFDTNIKWIVLVSTHVYIPSSTRHKDSNELPPLASRDEYNCHFLVYINYNGLIIHLVFNFCHMFQNGSYHSKYLFISIKPLYHVQNDSYPLKCYILLLTLLNLCKKKISILTLTNLLARSYYFFLSPFFHLIVKGINLFDTKQY